MQRSALPRTLMLAALVAAMPLAAQDANDEEEAFATLKLTFTNHGLPLVGDEVGKFYVYEVDDRDAYVAWGHEDRVARFPEGTYDLVIRYENGEIEETIVRHEVEFKGDAEETIDFNVPVARLRVDITRGGVAVEPFTGSYSVYAQGRRDKPIVRKRPGVEIKLRPGLYDVEVAHRGPGGMRTQWVEGLLVDGSTYETVELGHSRDQLSHLRLTLLEDGRLIPPDDGLWRVFEAGRRDAPLAERRSGEMLGIEKGVYDVGAFVVRDGEQRERWLNGLTLEGDFEREIEMGRPQVELRFDVTDTGRPLRDAWCSVYEVGQRDRPLATAGSGEALELEPGTYDIGCFLRRGGLRADEWLRRRTVDDSGTLDVDLKPVEAFLTVLPRSGWRWRRGDDGGAARLLVLLDSSSRMRTRTPEGTRLEVALGSLAATWSSRPTALEIGLRTVGGDAGARECQGTSLRAGPALGNEDALSTALAGLVPDGAAPVGAALEQAVADLPPDPGNTIVLLTAGADACGGDVCAAAAELLRNGVAGRIFVVGFDLDRDQMRRLDCAGEQRTAGSSAELTAVLREVMREAVSAEDGTVAVFRPGRPAHWVAGGPVGRQIPLNQGTYDIRIDAGGRTFTWDAVEISGDFEAPAARRPRRR